MLKNILRASVAFLALGFLMQPKAALADWGRRHDDRHYYHYHDHPRFGMQISFLPRGTFDIRMGGDRYYYYDGIYYRSVGRDEYIIVNPPIGAIVNGIPVDYQAVVVNGITYYTDSGTYYIYTRRGYQVVPPPVTIVQPAPIQQVVVTQAQPVPAPAPATNTVTNADDSFTVNIPNDKGGYTSVLIKKSGNGFVGPQGEFYGEFPKVTQLKAMYAK